MSHHATAAGRLLSEADRIRNADHWHGDRDAASLAVATMAQVEATLALVETLDSIYADGVTIAGKVITAVDAP